MFKQKERVYHFDTYALVANTTKIRVSFALASLHDLIVPPMNVKITFINRDLDEEIFIEQLESNFVMKIEMNIHNNHINLPV